MNFVKVCNYIMIQTVFNLLPVRFALSIALFLLGHFYFAIGNIYRGIICFCWIYRVSEISFLKRMVFPKIQKLCVQSAKEDVNPIRESYLQNRHSQKAISRFSDGNKLNEIISEFCIVLKSPTEKECGILLLKYEVFFDFFNAYFDLKEIHKKYSFVLEMSWAGACNVSYFMYLNPHNSLFVEAAERDDAQFFETLKTNVFPIDRGPGDWVDTKTFTELPSTIKDIDILMVGHWGKVKNHAILFNALKKLKTKCKVVLVGQPSGNRTLEDVKKEFQTIVRPNLTNIEIEFIEKIPFQEVKKLYHRAKCSLLLTFKEGQNKAVMESMFCGTPVILLENHIGGAQNYINEQTGVFANESNLHEKIEFMMAHYQEFNPREFVFKHTGSQVSTKILNERISSVFLNQGKPWSSNIVEKQNCPFLAYSNLNDKEKFRKDFEFLLSKKRNI